MEQNEEVTTRELLEQSDELMRESRRLLADIDDVLAKGDDRLAGRRTGVDRGRRADRRRWGRRD